MKFIKDYLSFEGLNESVPQDGFHNRFFKDPEPGLTNFIEVAITTLPVIDKRRSSEPAGSKSNPIVEVINLDKPFQYKPYYTDSYSDISKVYVYTIAYSGKRYANSEFPNQFFESVDARGGGVWKIKYDADKQEIFSPQPTEKNLKGLPKPYDFFLRNFTGNLPVDGVGYSDIRPYQCWCWKNNIHNTVEVFFLPDGRVDEVKFTKSYNPTLEIELPNWKGQNISDDEISSFLLSYNMYKQE